MNGDGLSRAWMKELKIRCVKSDAGNSTFRGFRRVVFPVADHRVADCRELHPDLILQSRHQRNPDERGVPKRLFDGIPKFGTSRRGVAFPGQFLKHAVSSKVVNERPFFGAGTPANRREVLPHRSVGEKLSNQCVPIRLALGKEQHPGGKTIDAVHDHCPLPLPLQLRGKKRQGGRSIGALHGHSRQAGRFVDGYDSIVFVQHNQLS